MKKLRPPVYLFKRDENEIKQAYEQNSIQKYKWEPLRRNPNSAQIPFGYRIDADPDILIPIDFELDVLEHAKSLLLLRDENPIYEKYYSLRKLAKWVTDVTGRKITHQGLKVRMEDDYERQEREKREIYKRVQEELRKEATYRRSETTRSLTNRRATKATRD